MNFSEKCLWDEGLISNNVHIYVKIIRKIRIADVYSTCVKLKYGFCHVSCFIFGCKSSPIGRKLWVCPSVRHQMQKRVSWGHKCSIIIQLFESLEYFFRFGFGFESFFLNLEYSDSKIFWLRIRFGFWFEKFLDYE